jgi:hypothetical protein
MEYGGDCTESGKNVRGSPSQLWQLAFIHDQRLDISGSRVRPVSAFQPPPNAAIN